MKASRKVSVTNDLGIHLRTAGVLVQAAGQFEASIWLDRSGERANAKSIMSVLSLAACKGVELEIIAEGPDAEGAVTALYDLIEAGFES